MAEELISESGNYSVDFWDTSIAPTLDSLPPPIYSGDPGASVNPFLKTDRVYLIVGAHVIDMKHMGTNPFDPVMWCVELYTLFNVSCVEMSRHLYDTLSPYWQGEKVTLITEEMARDGKTFFADFRAAGKVWIPNSDPQALLHAPDGVKMQVEITDEIVGRVRDFMFIFARETIQDEFERRFLAMRPGGTVEATSWEVQKHEAREWLTNQGQNGSSTPFLDYLSVEHQRDKTELATRILEKAEAYQDALSTMLVQEQKLVKEFKSAATVWDINILYEKYFGLAVPINQAKAMGWTEGPDSNVRTTEVPHGFQF